MFKCQGSMNIRKGLAYLLKVTSSQLDRTGFLAADIIQLLAFNILITRVVHAYTQSVYMVTSM